MKKQKKNKPGSAEVGTITSSERTKEIGSERARVIFHARTKVDPLEDAVVFRVAGVAAAAALIRQVKALDVWMKPVREKVRLAPPSLLGWIKPSLRAAGPARGEAEGEPSATVTFGLAAGIAPGKNVDLVPLTDRVIAFRDDVLKLAGVGKTLGADLEQLVGELTYVQKDKCGRQGAFLEALGSGKPRDESRWRFLTRLHREWAAEGRGELEPTETGLLAVYLGVDDGRGGVNGVVKRWSEMIQKAKAMAAQRATDAGKSFSSAPET